MKRKITILLIYIVLSLVLISPQALAEASLVSLQINEDIKPGPDSIYLTVTAKYSDGSSRTVNEPIWSTSDQTIATISYNGMLHFTGKDGALTVRVYKDGISATKTVTVNPWPKKIDIETDLIETSNPYRLMLLGEMSNDEKRYLGPDDGVVWSTSNPWVAWVNSQGVVTFAGEEGYVTIKAVVGNLSDSVSVSAVGDSGESTAWRKGIKIKEEIKYSSEPQELTLVAVLSDGTEEELANSAADWSSSNKDVAVISSEGVITFTGKPGFTTVKVTYGGYNYETVVSVGRFMTSISINQSLNYTSSWDGKSLPLSATVIYNDGSEYIQSSGLSWSVDNKKIAEISSDGVLTFTGKAGKVKVTVSGQASSDSTANNSTLNSSVTVEVPEANGAVAQKLFIDCNPISSEAILPVKAYCIYSDGSLRDVSELASWVSGTPETASVFQGSIYLSPVPGPISISASYLGLNDQITGYNYGYSGKAEKINQIRIKQHGISFSYEPLKLTALAQMGDGSIKEVSSNVTWYSSRTLIAKIKNGVLSFTGRIGKATITMQGYGFREQLEVEVTPAELQPQVVKLVIEGELTKGAVQLKAAAYYNDGKIRDVTSETVWNTSNKNAAVVTKDGMVMFLGSFKPVRITANFAGREASVNRE